MGVNYKDFIHPLDEAARTQLEGLPGFQKLQEWYLEIGLERLIHGIYMANSIRLSLTQLPDIYNHLPPICRKFGIKEPEFYLSMNPVPNAWTTGDNQTFLTVTSGLVELLNSEELDAVLAHECGHILCRHVLYQCMGQTLVQFSSCIPLGATLLQPIIQGLYFWMRRSEFSADRASSLFYGNSIATAHALIRLAGGPPSVTRNLNFDEYARQADEYETHKKNKWDRLLQNLSIVNQSHPYMAVRVRELLQWEQSEEFERLRHKLAAGAINRTCSCCGRIIDNSQAKFCTYCGEVLS